MSEMTNEQKYKTAEERVRAFGEFCKNEFCNQCNHLDCKFYKQGSEILRCYDGWLALEAEEEKPEPCPFCGDATRPRHLSGGFCVECDCGYTSPFAETEVAALAAHNRVARAIRAAKESEVRK